MIRQSIRWRLTVWYACALTAALVLFGVLIQVSVQSRLLSEIDEDLAGRAARFETYFLHEFSKEGADAIVDELEEFCAGLPRGSFVELDGPRGFSFRYPAATTPRSAVRTFRREFKDAAGGGYVIVAGESVGWVNHTAGLLRFQLFAMTPLAIALACIGGWLLSRRALKPVADMAHAAEAISIENLSVRLDVPKTGDELERFGEAFNTMLKRLEAAVNTLSQFVADASHELRTPLAVIRASAEIALRRARSPESYRESLAGIAQETERITTLVEDLLFLARNDAAMAARPRTLLDVNSAAREAVGEIENLAAARAIRIRLSKSEQPAFASGNPGALKRLFIALLDNAIKHSPDGGEVGIGIEAAGGFAIVAIRDHGGGIQADDMPHIFKRFYRADKSRTGEGYGLGLSIAESIARAHSASIDVASTPFAGSTFTVRIPLAAPGEKPVRALEAQDIPA